MNVPLAVSTSGSLSDWVDAVARLTRPNRVVWCDGSEDERRRLTVQAVRERVPASFSYADDVPARSSMIEVFYRKGERPEYGR